jgi:hypothetical protein
MFKPKHPAGPPMTLGNMRELGVYGLDAAVPDSQPRSPVNVRTSFLQLLFDRAVRYYADSSNNK